MKSFAEFTVGDLVFSDMNKGRTWTVVETSSNGVKLLWTHLRDGDRVGDELGKYAAVDSFWYCGELSFLHIVRRRRRARVV